MAEFAVIRLIEAADAARWRELFDGYIAFYEAVVSPHVVDRTWTRILNSEDGFVGLAADDGGGHLIGFAHLLFHHSTWSVTGYCYLEDLFVDPAARGQGAGRSLIEATLRLAEERGATRTYWVTQEDNAAARRLYDQFAQKAPFVQYRC